MALAFGVALFIFGDIHDKSGDRTDGGMGPGAITSLILVLLVVRLPAPAEFEAGCLAVPGLVDEGFHFALLLMALEGEARLDGEHARKDAQYDGLSKMGSFPEREQKQGTPTTGNDELKSVYKGSCCRSLPFVTLLPRNWQGLQARGCGAGYTSFPA